MGSAERREREKENLRQGILEAARDILSEKGLTGLSMRAIAERIEYSPATIYLYFQDKDALIGAVVQEGFTLLGDAMRRAVAEAGPGISAAEVYRCTGRAYVRFALENTAYFRIMFELPGLPQMDCPEPSETEAVLRDEQAFDYAVNSLRRAVEGGELVMPDPVEGAVIGWGIVHGLTSLFLSGRLADMVQSSEEFLALVDASIETLAIGWLPRPPGTPGSEPRQPAGLRAPHPCAHNNRALETAAGHPRLVETQEEGPA